MRTPISISKDGVWAGNGILEDGRIVDCAADLATDTESCEQAYEMIEEAISEGKHMVIAGSEGQVNFAWRIGN
tara:strand:- start:8156 stop:8374 length:219 start_codon:yes stop_codon:yes gene_type:complete